MSHIKLLAPRFIICGGPDADDDCDRIFGVIVLADVVMPPAFSTASANFWLEQAKPRLSERGRQILSDEIRDAGLRPDLTNHDRRVMVAVEKFGVDRMYEMFANINLPANRVLIQVALTGSAPVEFDPIYKSLLSVFKEVIDTIR